MAPPPDLRDRTRAFALRIVRLADSLPAGRSSDVIGRQLLRSGTSVGANYRSARRARSPAEFLAKLGVVEEEADETAFWLDILAQSGTVKPALLADLTRECDEILAIVVAAIRTAKRNSRARSVRRSQDRGEPAGP